MSIDHVRAVIERVKSEGFTAFDARTVRTNTGTPAPVPRAALAAATLPNGAPLPATWREWLAFDGSWLMQLGWFSSLEPLVWTPRTLHAIATAQLGRMWAQYYPRKNFDHCFLLAGGSDSRRVLALTDKPDAEGEHPVLWLDVDDMPAMGVWMPGLDLYLAWAAGITDEPPAGNRTYSDWAKLPHAKERSKHHVTNLLRGEWDMEFPNRLDAPPEAKPKVKKPATRSTAKTKPKTKPKPKPKKPTKAKAKTKKR